MTPTERPAPPGADEPIHGADEPIDGVDLALLAELRALYGDLDPAAPDLVERIQFALALEDLDVEVFRASAGSGVLAGVRGAEETRTITFDSDSLTIMFSISPAGPAAVRLDGWLAPPAAHRVELRTEGGAIQTDADADGRFAVDDVPHGLAQLVVHPAGGVRPVVTPSVVL
jgi:hypothetical protein